MGLLDTIRKIKEERKLKEYKKIIKQLPSGERQAEVIKDLAKHGENVGTLIDGLPKGMKPEVLADVADTIETEATVSILADLSTEQAKQALTPEVIEAMKIERDKGMIEPEEIAEKLVSNSETEQEKVENLQKVSPIMRPTAIGGELAKIKNGDDVISIAVNELVKQFKRNNWVVGHPEYIVGNIEDKELIIKIVDECSDRLFKDADNYVKIQAINTLRTQLFKLTLQETDKVKKEQIEKMKIDRIEQYYQNNQLESKDLGKLIKGGLEDENKFYLLRKYNHKKIKSRYSQNGKLSHIKLEDAISEQEKLDIITTMKPEIKNELLLQNLEELTQERPREERKEEKTLE